MDVVLLCFDGKKKWPFKLYPETLMTLFNFYKPVLSKRLHLSSVRFRPSITFNLLRSNEHIQYSHT